MSRQAPSVFVGGFRIRASEMRVLRLLVGGKLNKQIAAELGIAVCSVENHMENIRKRLGLRTRVQIAVWAVRNGIE